MFNKTQKIFYVVFSVLKFRREISYNFTNIVDILKSPFKFVRILIV